MGGYGGKGCGEIIMQNELKQLRNMPRRLKMIRREKRINALKTMIKSLQIKMTKKMDQH